MVLEIGMFNNGTFHIFCIRTLPPSPPHEGQIPTVLLCCQHLWSLRSRNSKFCQLLWKKFWLPKPVPVVALPKGCRVGKMRIRSGMSQFFICTTHHSLLSLAGIALMSGGPLDNDLNRFYLDLNIWNVSLVSSSMEENFWNKPTLLWFTPKLGLDTETGMELLCLVAMLLSLLAMSLKSFRNSIVFFILWFFYFSLYQVRKFISLKKVLK